MKIWLLLPSEATADVDWWPTYDSMYGFVVAAETEEEARELAQADGGDETNRFVGPERSVWTNPAYTTCEVLDPFRYSKPTIIISDFNAG